MKVGESMTSTETDNRENYISYLQGGRNIDLDRAVSEDADTLARSMVSLLENKDRYHRGNFMKALVALINSPVPDNVKDPASTYRSVAWEMFQMDRLPLSHILEAVDVVKSNGKSNTRRLRYAIAHRIAKSRKDDIVRAYFIAPDKFRSLFYDLYIQRTRCDDKEIVNDRYLLAYALSQTSTDKFMNVGPVGYEDFLGADTMAIRLETDNSPDTAAKAASAIMFRGAKDKAAFSPASLLSRFGIPMHMVMQRVGSADEAVELAHAVRSDDFFRHARWFRNAMGDVEFDKFAEAMADDVQDPTSFLAIKEHLEQTGAISAGLSRKLEQRAEQVMEDMLANYDVDSLALIVDVSSSMQSAVSITQGLYQAFSRAKTGITDIIAFNTQAKSITHHELATISCSGMTSIGSSFVLLNQRIQRRKDADVPQAIILISDMDENSHPFLRDALPLLQTYDSPPVIVLHVGGYRGFNSGNMNDYPHAVLEVSSFHPQLAQDVMQRIVRLTSKAAVKDVKTTKVVKERRIEEEEVGDVELPRRSKATFRSGYMASVLCKE